MENKNTVTISVIFMAILFSVASNSFAAEDMPNRFDPKTGWSLWSDWMRDDEKTLEQNIESINGNWVVESQQRYNIYTKELQKRFRARIADPNP